MSRALRLRGVTALGLVLASLGACRSSASQRQRLSSSYPLEQITATVALAEVGDHDVVARLVGLLEDRDETVRMYAILALQRLCGQTYGYKYYAADVERETAVRRWQEALRNGEVTVTPRPTEPPAGSAAASAPTPAAAEPPESGTEPPE